MQKNRKTYAEAHLQAKPKNRTIATGGIGMTMQTGKWQSLLEAQEYGLSVFNLTLALIPRPP